MSFEVTVLFILWFEVEYYDVTYEKTERFHLSLVNNNSVLTETIEIFKEISMKLS